MLSFYKLREGLKQTVTFYQGVVIKNGSEAYTSKQCGRCGALNEKLGSSEVFQCPACGLKADKGHACREKHPFETPCLIALKTKKKGDMVLLSNEKLSGVVFLSGT